MKNKTIIEKILFSSKWLLIPFYIGLIISLAIFTYIDVKEIYHLFHIIKELDEDAGMTIILKLIDLTMIANLVKMIIVGSYTSFFQKHGRHDNSTDDPNLNTSSGVLKVKIATSLIGVTSINLLQTFINPVAVDPTIFRNQLIIHVMFLIGAVVLAVVDWLHVKAEMLHHEDCVKHTDIPEKK
jgi:uncharacterized protein (TIGR00645 family)